MSNVSKAIHKGKSADEAKTFINSQLPAIKRRHSFFSEKTGLNLFDPCDLHELERETLLVIKAELESESGRLATQIKQLTALHHQEVNRISSKRFFVMGLVDEARLEISKITSAKKLEKHKLHSSVFMDVTREVLGVDQFRQIQDEVYRRLREEAE